MGPLEDFLKQYPDFKLGHLLTESLHPDTMELSELAKNDLDRAISVLRAVDSRALNELLKYSHSIDELHRAVRG